MSPGNDKDVIRGEAGGEKLVGLEVYRLREVFELFSITSFMHLIRSLVLFNESICFLTPWFIYYKAVVCC